MAMSDIPIYEQMNDLLDIMCPCNECITLAICRHKRFLEIFNNCYMIAEYIPNYNQIHERNEYKIIHLEQIMRPTLWKFEFDKQFSSRYIVFERKTYSTGENMPILNISGGMNPV